ncbi:MAG TPA: alpha/beta hydrolase-fold protein [Allosphingosinicella sp.]|nr:alpha/beta hydrolase-fold protein [Allosphingosinicella sp.]
MKRGGTAIGKLLLALALAAAASGAHAEPTLVAVAAAPTLPGPLSGRLIVFARKVTPGDDPAAPVDSSAFNPNGTAVAARELPALGPGDTTWVDADSDAFPAAFSQLPPGRYRFQAVLDRNHDYNYGGRGQGDVVSPIVEATLPGIVPSLILRDVIPGQPAASSADRSAQVVPLDFASPRLSAFWGRPIHIRGWIGLPPAYDPASRASWPVVYSAGGFGSTLETARQQAVDVVLRMADGDFAPMIWVVLDQSSPTGTHEFADSVNNGPWGEALTAELIPWLEQHYRMDARPNGRFLTGHSSGGWATLWLQTRYPKLFGGTWSTSPDPSDFRDFTGIDIYAPGANAYVDAAGRPRPLVRDGATELAGIGEFARLENALGAYGGQFASFDWVFSPKGPDGRPMPLFDRRSGAIDPAVAAYWRAHYDIADRLARDWASLKPDLDAKIHIFVGTADTFRLEGSAHRLQAVLDGLGARSTFEFIPNRNHFDLFEEDGDPEGLMRRITWDMYAIARPGAARPDLKR